MLSSFHTEAPGADCPVALNWMIHNKWLDIPRDTFWYIIHYINHFVKLINEFVIKSAQQCWQIAYKQPQLRQCDTTLASGSQWLLSRPAEVNWILLITHSLWYPVHTVPGILALTLTLNKRSLPLFSLPFLIYNFWNENFPSVLNEDQFWDLIKKDMKVPNYYQVWYE